MDRDHGRMVDWLAALVLHAAHAPISVACMEAQQ
jgi:hypothetical protein